ncbi:MAG: HK97 gp10 family phage protein [Methanoregula sp.]|jgi:HK97 gp10 family phage protein|nr:HK97 gp10 family phage protein [Methanoregula sp.]
MSSVASITVSGMDDLQRKLSSLGADLAKELSKSGLKAMKLNVEDKAKEKCVVDTGNLRASINTQEVMESGKSLIKTGTTVFYAPYIEFGTGVYAENGNGRKTPWLWKVQSPKWEGILAKWIGADGTILWYGSRAHPFLRPAFDEGKEQVMDDIKADLQAAIARYQG